MRARELVGTTAALALVVAASVTTGILLLLGVVARGNQVDAFWGWALIGVGAVVALAGVGLAVSVSVRAARREDARGDTDSASSGTAIPDWGMGDRGEAAGRVVTVGERTGGGGSPRPVGFSVSHLDVPLVIVGLLLWTALFLVLFAPYCAAGVSTC